MRDKSGGQVALPNGQVRRILKTVPPKYPAHLIDMNVAGEVVLRIVVRADGTVANAEAVTAPHPDLARSAEHAVMQWRFEPAPDGDKRGLVLEQRLRFGLEDPDKAK